MSSRIFQINTSPGGVPKLPIREAGVSELGLVGDGVITSRISMADPTAPFACFL